MATGTFTYNALRTKTPRGYKNIKKNCKSFKLDKSNAVSLGMTAVEPYAWWARYNCGKIYSPHLFSYGGLYLDP